MASTYRFYLAATIGDGAPATRFRSKLCNYLVQNATQDFWSWPNSVTSNQFCLAWCPTALHTTIAADVDVVPLSSELADVAAVTAYLDAPVGTIPTGVATALENNGIPLDWVTITTTPRQIWQFISIRHSVAERINGAGNANALSFLRNNLDTQVSAISVAVRNAVASWMQAQGIDASWIVGTTTVRAVLKFIVVNWQLPIMNYGPVSF